MIPPLRLVQGGPEQARRVHLRDQVAAVEAQMQHLREQRDAMRRAAFNREREIVALVDRLADLQAALAALPPEG